MMMLALRCAGVALVLSLGAAIALAQDEGAVFDDLRQQWAELYAAGDMAALVELYAEDARYYMPTAQVLEGRQAIQEGLQQEVEQLAAQTGGGDVQIDIQATSTGVFDDAAHEVGTFTVSTAEGEEIEHGQYAVVSRLVDGQWQIAHHLVTSSLLGQLMEGAGAGEP